MSDNVEGFTFTWEIENFSMLPHQNGDELKSDTFVVEQWKNMEWNLSLYPRGDDEESEGYISLYLEKTAEDVELKITYSLTIASTEPSSDNDIYGLFENQAIKLNYGFHTFIRLSDIYEKKELYLPNDTLTLRCGLRPADASSEETIVRDKSESVPNFLRSCKTRTGIHVHRRLVTLSLPNIKELTKDLLSGRFLLETALTKSVGLKITLHFTELSNDGFLKIDISQTSLPFKKERIFVKCKMAVISAHRKYQDSKESTHLFQLSLDDVWNFPNFLMTSNLTRDEYLYLDDTLLLQCEFAFSYKGTVYHSETNYAPLIFEVKEERSARELYTNLEELYSNGKFCDVDLRIGDESFPAHKVVLCAMSPVFRAMFENDMKEKDSSMVKIEDVDADTLKRMLTYMYSDALEEDLSLENAKKLFSAADKYDIVTLRRKCSLLLVSSLSVESVCDVLVLADAHHDNFLLTAVYYFISNHANETFHSEHWERFMNLNPKLSLKIMHQVWKNKGPF